MAIGASIYKVNLELSNFNSNFYESFNLTIAKHPSENEERMMFRLLAFCFCAHPDLSFTRGLSSSSEPELWRKGYSEEILHWIELGEPDDKRLRQASGRSQKVSVFTYHYDLALLWFEKNKNKFRDNKKLEVYHFQVIEEGPLDKLVEKSMRLSCLIEDDMLHLSSDQFRIGIKVIQAKKASFST